MFNAEELNLLYGLARTLGEDRDYGELLTSLLDRTIESLGADRGFVLVRENGGFRAAVARNFRSEALSQTEAEVSSSIANEVLQTGKAVLVGNALDSDRYKNHPSVQRLSLRSVLCAPLLATSETFALIYLENRDIAQKFTNRQRELLDEICSLSAARLHVALAIESARRKARELESHIGEADGIITADPAVGAVLETVRQVAATDLPVLIQGETGTGKELVARALYRQSSRSSGPFVILNCAVLPASLIESELFGVVRGAFTGADRDRVGLIGSAHRGTLFLDEIGELPVELQPRLLRVLQSGEFTRLGSTRTETADIRVIAATNRDLEREIESGAFRSDLFFRLATITLKLPPLRERVHDIPLLADHFLKQYATRFGRETGRLSAELLASLLAYSFPGNVRELEAEMARLAALSRPGAVLMPDALSDRIRGTQKDVLQPMSIAEMEKRLIVLVLKTTDGNRTRAAEILGISREGLRTKMQRYGLSDASQ
ncbi:MAG TPA: sigma-54-dependent Fis family transcriptional regulator [Terriglobia bacterium]|jgi:transcriptional regulator with GAF, ATPase, and Fis domain